MRQAPFTIFFQFTILADFAFAFSEYNSEFSRKRLKRMTILIFPD